MYPCVLADPFDFRLLLGNLIYTQRQQYESKWHFWWCASHEVTHDWWRTWLYLLWLALSDCFQFIKSATSITSFCLENNLSCPIMIHIQVLPQLQSPLKFQSTSISDAGYVLTHGDIDVFKSLMSWAFNESFAWDILYSSVHWLIVVHTTRCGVF